MNAAIREMSVHSLKGSLAEALIAAYVEGKTAPYRVPYHLDGDLFLFTQAKTYREAIETVRGAADAAVSRAIGAAPPAGGGP